MMIHEDFPTVGKFADDAVEHFNSYKWYQAKYDFQNYINVHSWCAEHFGTPMMVGSSLNMQARWHLGVYNRIIYFRDEKDHAWFLLRWGV